MVSAGGLGLPSARYTGNLTVHHQGGELAIGEIIKLAPEGLVDAELYETGLITNIDVIHEKGRKEPWIIAMNVTPSEYTVLEYGMRWGIEAMLKDFKTRGFSITQSQIKKPDRLARLVLVLATGRSQPEGPKSTTEHNAAKKGVRKA